MNNERRKVLKDIISRLYTIEDELTQVQEQEQEAFDNLDAIGQGETERAETISSNADSLQEQVESINDIISNLEELL